MTVSAVLWPVRREIRVRTLALLLLLAWAPPLFFLDHWPAPAFLGESLDTRHHADQRSVGQAHVEHGHGSGADGVAGAVVAPPVPGLVVLDVPLVAEPEIAQPMRDLTWQSPEVPPPR